MTSTRAVVVVAHPRPESFNHALARTVVAALDDRGLGVALHDLYADGFDPVLPAAETWTAGDLVDEVFESTSDELLARYRDELVAADLLVVVHPNWWGKPPAMMSGWLDRVLVPGVAYRLSSAGGVPENLLRLRDLVVLNTSDTDAEREAGVFGDPLDAIWRQCVGEYVGRPRVHRRVFRVVSEADEHERRAWLAEAADLAVGVSGASAQE